MSSSSFLQKYKVLSKVGEGSFAEVLKCQERETGTLVAAKRLKKIRQSMDEVLSCTELISLLKLSSHPHILNMIEKHVDPFPGKLTIIFELMDMSLYDLIKSRKRCIPESRVKQYIFQIFLGLAHMHKNGLFHRDIKPENILLKNDVVKIADLGSVKGIYMRRPFTEYISTRWYRSPECLLTKGVYGPKMDVWATGCVFYELITLRPLFPGSTEIDMIHKIHDIIGTPTYRTISKLKHMRNRNCECLFPAKQGRGICSLLPNMSEAGRDIIEQTLVYDPDLRSHVRRLLEHRYFNDLRDGEDSVKRRSSNTGTDKMSTKSSEWRNPMLLSYLTSAAAKRKKVKATTITSEVTEPKRAIVAAQHKVPSHIVKQPSVQRAKQADRSVNAMELSRRKMQRRESDPPLERPLCSVRLPSIQPVDVAAGSSMSTRMPTLFPSPLPGRECQLRDRLLLPPLHRPEIVDRGQFASFAQNRMDSTISNYRRPQPSEVQSLSNAPKSNFLRLPPIAAKRAEPKPAYASFLPQCPPRRSSFPNPHQAHYRQPEITPLYEKQTYVKRKET